MQDIMLTVISLDLTNIVVQVLTNLNFLIWLEQNGHVNNIKNKHDEEW